jgi:enterochelin esterase-like enzyme
MIKRWGESGILGPTTGEAAASDSCQQPAPRRRLLRPSLLVAALLLGACAPANPVPATVAPALLSAQATQAAPLAFDTQPKLLSTLQTIRSAPPEVAQARADAFWQALVSSGRDPLIFDPEVYFFYKGPARHVDWRGGFNQWSVPGLEGTRVGETDLWMAQWSAARVPASRAEYQIAVDDQPLAPDTANPLTQASGVTGTNSLLMMPGFTVSDLGQRASGAAAGVVSEPLSITIQFLGYVVDYWVYTPAGYEHQANLPALYLMDGNSFVSDRQGALPIVLDNLIASGRIPPVLAVFVDPREPGNPQNNRREPEFLGHPSEHARFIAEELVPAIDRAYCTEARPAARVIAGASFGGLSAIFIGITQPATFHNLAAFSPSLWALDYSLMQPNAEQVAGVGLMAPSIQAVTRCSAPGSAACPRLPLKLFMTSGVPSWDVGDLSGVAATLVREGYALDFHSVREAHTWSQWRGLSDEMLVFFFGGQT